MDIRIDSKSPVPAYLQVAQNIKLQILSARIKPGDLLPTIRDLAKYLRLNPNTVARAYDNLEREGFLESRQGSGSWARLPRGKSDSLRLSLLQSECRSFLEKALALGFCPEEIIQSMQKVMNHEPNHSGNR
jgi:GntR family transcriptional regulator